MNGTVKWFNVDKHIGFITSDEDNKDYFVHMSELPKNKILKEGDKVTFTAEVNDKGPIAKQVKLL